ncbi:MAG: biotin--[acetyl-CoA-carboxylase] ligase [Coriobacteriia bacterium]|nr:biotin--[acetyl-CoA-carboxylase] ligase [Coriobacteriia bacterium]
MRPETNTTMIAISRRAAVASALHSAGPGGLSGEVLARELGISRVAIAKHVAALRDLGYRVESSPRVGYRLLEAPDACIPEEVSPRLADPLWVSCTGGLETGSTNDDAKTAARAGSPEGTLVVAARQHGGRGRFGRVWISPSGGAYASAILRPALPPAALGPLALVIALGVARGLERFGVPTGLKWPNDVLADGEKLAGILLEMAAEADTVEWLVFGCGLNVAGPAGPGSAWVRRYSAEAKVAEVAATVLDECASAYRTFLAEGFANLVGEYRARGTLWGRDVVVRDGTGRVVASGIAETVDDSGALVVREAGGARAVVAGEVTLRS